LRSRYRPVQSFSQRTGGDRLHEPRSVVQPFNPARTFAQRTPAYPPGVELSDLTPRQAQALAARLAPSLGYLVRLTNRMQQAGWRADDAAHVAG